MIGLLDEIILASIRKVWVDLVTTGVTEWRKMFHANLGNERIDKLFAHLTGASTKYTGATKDYVKFGLAELQNRNNDAPPGVFVRIANIQPGSLLDGSEESEAYIRLNTTIEVIVLAERKDAAAALATAVANCIWTRRVIIATETGLEGPPRLTGISEIGPVRDILPDRAGATWYRLQYACGSDMNLVSINEPAPTAIGFTIHDDRVVDEDGIIGRVNHTD